MKVIFCILLGFLNLQGIAFAQDSVITHADTVGISRLKLTSQTHRALNLGAPALLLSYGFISLDETPVRRLDEYIQHKVLEGNPSFSTHLDNHLRHAPVLAVYVLNVFGIKGKNNLLDRTAIFLFSNMIMSRSVDFLKDKTRKQRPSGGDYRSFPSGHASIAFAAAEFMRLEYEHLSPWYAYAAYSAAAATGALRMLNNEHWFSDVIAGAGAGIISTRIAYIVYPWLKKKIAGKKEMKFYAAPISENGYLGLSFAAPL
jgi:hypothetical protein